MRTLFVCIFALVAAVVVGGGLARADDSILVDRDSLKFQLVGLINQADKAEKLLSGAKPDAAAALVEIRALKQEIEDLGKRVAAAKSVDSVGTVGAKNAGGVTTSAMYVTPIGEASLRIVMERMQKDGTPEGKLRVLRDAAANTFFVSDQCIRVLGAFANVDDRIRALEQLMPRLLDRQNADKVLVVFPFAGERERARSAMARIFAAAPAPVPTAAP